MLDWIKSWFGTSGKTVIYIDSVTFPCGCCPKPKPAAPGKPTLFSGDSVHMIMYPVTVTGVVKDAKKVTFHFTENGGPESTVDLLIGGDTASGSFTVQDGAVVDYWADQADAAGNVSAPSAHGAIASAADTVPPPAPSTPVPGAGDTAPELVPSLGRGVVR